MKRLGVFLPDWLNSILAEGRSGWSDVTEGWRIWWYWRWGFLLNGLSSGVLCLVAQSCMTLRDPVVCSLPGSLAQTRMKQARERAQGWSLVKSDSENPDSSWVKESLCCCLLRILNSSRGGWGQGTPGQYQALQSTLQTWITNPMIFLSAISSLFQILILG